jgi:aryl-alcohol dehydrogenase-like predicted oxidoreductase
LDIDYIDLCKQPLLLAETLGVMLISTDYLHHANPETPIEETMRALAELQA